MGKPWQKGVAIREDLSEEDVFMKKIALLFAVTAAVAAAAIACGDIKPPMDPSALGSASAMPGAPEAPAAPSGAPSGAPAMPGK